MSGANERKKQKERILGFQGHCRRYLSPLLNPNGKSILVLGSGWGTEMLWCAEGGAAEVVGIDPAQRSLDALKEVMRERGIHDPPPVEYHRIDSLRVPEVLGKRFDVVLSNNVFEHIGDIEGTLRSLRETLRSGGRIAIFSAPLYFSSAGSHMRVLEPWQHLWAEPGDMRKLLSEEQRKYMKQSLNKMTVQVFLDGVRNAGLVALQLTLYPDRNVQKIDDYLLKIRERFDIAPFDLTVEGIGCELCFPDDV
jgi:ubiquinone/menaquinone biosynthesis C-methylase UbiE